MYSTIDFDVSSNRDGRNLTFRDLKKALQDVWKLDEILSTALVMGGEATAGEGLPWDRTLSLDALQEAGLLKIAHTGALVHRNAINGRVSPHPDVRLLKQLESTAVNGNMIWNSWIRACKLRELVMTTLDRELKEGIKNGETAFLMKIFAVSTSDPDPKNWIAPYEKVKIFLLHEKKWEGFGEWAPITARPTTELNKMIAEAVAAFKITPEPKIQIQEPVKGAAAKEANKPVKGKL